MSWRSVCVMDERMKFIVCHGSDKASMVELCRIFGISRKTGYKFVNRYKLYGVDGLKDISRAPHSHPNHTSWEAETLILQARSIHPSWGPRKILAWLSSRHSEVNLPAISTAGDILKRHGMVKSRRRKRKCEPYNEPFKLCEKPNDVWCADFKGWFKTSDGKRCDPLTISDAYSRYLLECRGLARTGFGHVKPAFEKTFREYGMPLAIRTDNGPPFASIGAGGISKLSIWFVKLGITPERIQPGHPEQNGRHERMHKTLKHETANPPKCSFAAQQRSFSKFKGVYNHERPHEALGDKTPAEFYKPSSRDFPEKLPELEYPEHMKIRLVHTKGGLKWRGEKIYLSETLAGERVGLEQMTERYWQIKFGPVNIAFLDDFAIAISRKVTL